MAAMPAALLLLRLAAAPLAGLGMGCLLGPLEAELLVDAGFLCKGSVEQGATGDKGLGDAACVLPSTQQMNQRSTVPQRVLPALVLAQLAGTSPWFAVNAVMPDLQREFGWDAAAVGTLTSALQIGFIAGTLVFALLAVADRWPARRVFLCCALAAAGCTLAAAASAPSFAGLLVWRTLTGFFLAGIYPVGMKIASQWFPQGLGAALGWLVGRTRAGQRQPTCHSALGADAHWTVVFYAWPRWQPAPACWSWSPCPEPVGGKRPPASQMAALATLWRDRRLRASVLATSATCGSCTRCGCWCQSCWRPGW
jgi:predicted MFS family arabinose efflux permease